MLPAKLRKLSKVIVSFEPSSASNIFNNPRYFSTKMNWLIIHDGEKEHRWPQHRIHKVLVEYDE